LLVKNQQLEKEKAKILEQNDILQKNISVLLKTAKAELLRKDRLVKDLRQT